MSHTNGVTQTVSGLVIQHTFHSYSVFSAVICINARRDPVVADFYALTVGVLADRLAGRDGLIQPWARPADSLTIEEKFELQQRLKDK
ncbi:MAG: hypothetical protein Q8K59_11155, partial [Nitrosomonas sp.]|nr:hypothetical protein [Nitrosomonas sp.]MDP1951629.1 hypothetical protein [Nitrosomonas sp.]